MGAGGRQDQNCVLGGRIGEELALETAVSIQKPLKSPAKRQDANSLPAAASEGQVLAPGRGPLRIWSTEQQETVITWDPLGMQTPRPRPALLSQKLRDGVRQSAF